MRRIRLLLWLLVAVAIVAAAYLFFVRAPQSASVQAPATQLTLGGAFSLTGSDGRPFRSSALQGRPYVIFFGFTHCPDVCPTTLARLVRLRSQLANNDRDLSIVFVTVDPERDGPAEVGKYAQLFNAPIIGLTGSPPQIEQVKKQFGIFSQKVPDGSGAYSVDHSAAALLFDAQGKFIATIAPEEPDSMALDKLKRAAQGAA